MVEQQEKVCLVCRTSKPKDEFHEHVNGTDWRSDTCRTCCTRPNKLVILSNRGRQQVRALLNEADKRIHKYYPEWTI